MPTSEVTNSNSQRAIYCGQQGLSLIEILVAIFLIAIASFIAVRNTFDARADLEDAIYGLERAIKLASQEAVLRNRVTRLRMNSITGPDEPHEYQIEIGQHHEILLPELEEENTRFGIDEKEKLKQQEQLDAGFGPIEEFRQYAKPLNDDILFIGMVTDYTKQLVIDTASLYFFPIGNRDAGLIFLASVDELAIIEVMTVSEEIFIDYAPLENSSYANYESIARKKAQQIAQTWSNANRQ